jgi:predicted nucleotidyltransferase
LNNCLTWDSETVQRIIAIGPKEATDLVKALEVAGLAKANRGKGQKTWRTTQSAQSFGSATAAKPITRQTASAALAEFLERVGRVNRDEHFLARVTRVVLFGSYLRPEVNRLGDVDVAVELQPKEADRERARELNYQRVAKMERNGRRFSQFLDRELWWRTETFRFLKGRSRSISLADYHTEKEFVDRVPHKILLSAPTTRAKPAKKLVTRIRRARRPKNCPF